MTRELNAKIAELKGYELRRAVDPRGYRYFEYREKGTLAWRWPLPDWEHDIRCAMGLWDEMVADEGVTSIELTESDMGCGVYLRPNAYRRQTSGHATTKLAICYAYKAWKEVEG